MLITGRRPSSILEKFLFVLSRQLRMRVLLAGPARLSRLLPSRGLLAFWTRSPGADVITHLSRAGHQKNRSCRLGGRLLFPSVFYQNPYRHPFLGNNAIRAKGTP